MSKVEVELTKEDFKVNHEKEAEEEQAESNDRTG